MRKTLSTGRSMPLVASTRKPAKIGLVLELEGPGQRPFEVHAVPVGQLVLAGEGRGGVARVQRAVAIAVLRIDRAGQAAQPSGSDSPMTIGLSFSSGNDAMIGKPSSIVAELVGDPHPHVAVDERSARPWRGRR